MSVIDKTSSSHSDPYISKQLSMSVPNNNKSTRSNGKQNCNPRKIKGNYKLIPIPNCPDPYVNEKWPLFKYKVKDNLVSLPKGFIKPIEKSIVNKISDSNTYKNENWPLFKFKNNDDPIWNKSSTKFTKVNEKSLRDKISEVVSEILTTLPTFIGSATILEWTDKTKIIPIAGGIFNAFGYLYRIGESILSAFNKGAALVTTPSVQMPAFLSKIVSVAANSMKYIKVGFSGTSLIAVGFALNNTRTIIRGNSSEKIDAALDLIRNMSDIGFGLSISLQGFADKGKLAGGVMHFIPGINIVSALLSGASILSSVRNSIQSQAVADMINIGTRRNSTKELRALLDEFIERDNSYLAKHFGSDSKALREQLRKVQRFSDMLIREGDDKTTLIDFYEGHKLIEKTLNNMRIRVEHQVWSNKMGVIAAVTSIIGLLILAIPPLAPFALIGLIFLAISTLTYTGSVIHDTISKAKFDNSINFVKTNHVDKSVLNPIEDENIVKRHRMWTERKYMTLSKIREEDIERN